MVSIWSVSKKETGYFLLKRLLAGCDFSAFVTLDSCITAVIVAKVDVAAEILAGAEEYVVVAGQTVCIDKDDISCS